MLINGKRQILSQSQPFFLLNVINHLTQDRAQWRTNVNTLMN